MFPLSYNEMLYLDKSEALEILNLLLTERGFDGSTISFYEKVLLSTDDNIIQSVGEAQSPRLWLIESYSTAFNWLASMVLGFICFRWFQSTKSSIS